MLLGGAASAQQKMDAHAASEITWANNGEFVCLISLENDTLSPRFIAFWSNVVRSMETSRILLQRISSGSVCRGG